MVKDYNNEHIPLDMNIANSVAIVMIFQDKAITFCWMWFMHHVPTRGDGTVANVMATILTSQCSQQIWEISRISLRILVTQVQFMGDNSQVLTVSAPTCLLQAGVLYGGMLSDT